MRFGISTNSTSTRYRAVGLLSVLALTTFGVTSCSSEGDDPDDSQANSDDAVFSAAWPYAAPPEGNFNLMAGVAGGIDLGYLNDLIMTPGALYMWDSQSYRYMVADDTSALSDDGKTFEYRVRDGLKWSDGETITGEDVYTSWMNAYALGNTLFDYVSDIELTDESTVTFTIENPAPIAEYEILRLAPVPTSEYGAFGKAAAALWEEGTDSDDPELKELAQEISQYDPDEAVVSGPFNFEYDTVSDAQLQLVKNSEGYNANDVAWDRIRVYNGEIEAVTPLVLAKKVDYATQAFPVATVNEFEAEGMRVLRNPTYFGRGLRFGMNNNPDFRDVRVRQAFAHIIDRESAAEGLYGESGKGVEYMAGISDLQIPQWFAEDEVDELNTYPLDPKRAQELLEEAGWSKDGDQWLNSTGEPASYELIYATGGAPNDNFVDDLREFGIQIESSGKDASQIPELVDAGDFDLVAQTWGSTSNPFPTDAFREALLAFNNPGDPEAPGMDFPYEQEVDGVSINLEEAVIASGRGATPADIEENVVEVGNAINELLPIIQIDERYAASPVLQSHVEGFPEDDDPIYRNSMYADSFVTLMLYDGTLIPNQSK